MYKPMTPAVAHPNVRPPPMTISATFIYPPEVAQSNSTTTNGVPLIHQRTGVRSGLRVREGTLIDSSAREVVYYRPSLTTPAVSRVFLSFFISLITEFAHTSPLAHEACPFRSSLLTCGTLTCSARFRSSIQCCPPNISSITNQP